MNSELWPQKRLEPLQNISESTLMIHEIYHSVQGESSYTGLPCVFVRTTACNLRCSYCDTRHAFTQGSLMQRSSIVQAIQAFNIKLVEITGGEPLLQPGVLTLMRELCDLNYTVLLETSGSLPIHSVDPRVVCIMDIKLPSSREAHTQHEPNYHALLPHHEVKCVIGSREDYNEAKRIIEQYNLTQKCQVLMSVVFEKLEPQTLVAWILEDNLPVRMQLQMHKYIWDPKQRGV